MSLNFIEKMLCIGGESSIPPTFQFYRRGFIIGAEAPTWQDIILSGNTALTLTNALANGLNYLKLFGGTEQRNIPSGYTQVEYLESDGTQYIDTGVKPNSNTAISIKYYPAGSSAFMCLYGTQDSSSLNRFYGLISLSQFKVQINSNAGQPPSFWGINKNGTLVAGSNGSFAQTQGIVTLGVDNKNKVVSIESDEYTGNISASDTVLGDNLNCQYNMLLLSRGTAGTPANNFSGRLYSFTIKENDVLIQNLIPKRRNSDNVLGMYDTVTGTFFTNAGTGTFTAGADVTAPTPDTPMDIICNNGVVKLSPNLFNKNDSDLGDGYISASTGEIVGTLRGHTGYFKVIPNTTYYVTLPTYQTGSANGIAFYNSSKTYISGFTSNISYGSEPHTFTVPSDNSIVYARLTLTENIAKTNLNEIQIEKGSTGTPIIPYGEIYTDGTQETVTVTGKNLWNPNGTDYGWIAQTGEFINRGVSRMVEVKQGETYTYKSYSSTNPFYNCIGLYDANKNFIAGTRRVIITGDTKTNTVTITDANVKYLACSYYTEGGQREPDWQMIVEGTGDIPYEPYYNGGTATAEMLLSVGDYKDVQSVIDGGVTRNVGVKVLDGTEDWSYNSQFSRFYTTIIPESITQVALRSIPAYCTHFKMLSNSEPVSSITPGQGYVAKTGDADPTWVYFHLSLTTASAFKQYLADQYNAGTPVIVVYPLAEPTTETVTGQPLSIQEGTNIIGITEASINDLPLEVSYKASV